jgi:hypothetical protein
VRLILFLVGTVSVGAVGVSQGVIPLPMQLVQAIRALGGDPTQLRTVNLNPVDAYNRVLPEILKGRTPEELGFHVSPVTAQPGNFRSLNGAPVNAGATAQNGFASGLVSQIQQNNIRMQDMAAYARNPAAWHGAPPH